MRAYPVVKSVISITRVPLSFFCLISSFFFKFGTKKSLHDSLRNYEEILRGVRWEKTRGGGRGIAVARVVCGFFLKDINYRHNEINYHRFAASQQRITGREQKICIFVTLGTIEIAQLYIFKRNNEGNNEKVTACIALHLTFFFLTISPLKKKYFVYLSFQILHLRRRWRH